jgi:hypothetical protein
MIERTHTTTEEDNCKKLWYSVLLQAIKDIEALQRNKLPIASKIASKKTKALFYRELRYFFSERCEELYNICDIIEIDVGRVRKKANIMLDNIDIKQE